MTFRDDATQALAEGRAAEIGASNPYAGESLVLAKMWMRGYMSMANERFYSRPSMQPYLKARAERDGISTS